MTSSSSSPESPGPSVHYDDTDEDANWHVATVPRHYMTHMLESLWHRERPAWTYLGQLEGRVVRFALSKVGCGVVAELANRTSLDCLIHELLGQALYLSEHKYGVRAMVAILGAQLQRPSDPSTSHLVSEILDNFKSYLPGFFGHRVLLALLDNGSLELRHQIVDALIQHPLGLVVVCLYQDACTVVALAFRLASEEQASAMAGQLLAAGVESLTTYPYGQRVLAALLRRGSERKKVLAQLREDRGNLDSSRFGRSLARHFNI